MPRRSAAQLAYIREAIAKLASLKARESQKAADAGKRSIAAESAASKTKQLSTATSKLKEANRYADLQAKHLVEVAKLEKKIAAEQNKLVIAERRVESEEAKVLKKRNPRALVLALVQYLPCGRGFHWMERVAQMGRGHLRCRGQLEGAGRVREEVGDAAQSFVLAGIERMQDGAEQVRVSPGFYDPEPEMDRDKNSLSGMLRIGNDRVERWIMAPALGSPEQFLGTIDHVDEV